MSGLAMAARCLLAFQLFCFSAFPQTRSALMVSNANGGLAAPTNFFAANSNLIKQASGPAGGGGGGGGLASYDATINTNGSGQISAAPSAVFLNVREFGVTNSPVFDQTAGIASAVAAINLTGGTLYFPSGVYTNRGPYFLQTNVTILGDGMGGTAYPLPLNCLQLTNGATWIAYNSATQPLFIYSNTLAGRIEKVGLVNFAANPTAGAVVLCTNGTSRTSWQKIDLESVFILGGWNGLEQHDGYLWNIHNCIFEDQANYGIWFENTDWADAGDWSISDTIIIGPFTGAATAGIFGTSGAGGKIVNTKINCNFTNDILYLATANTSDMTIANCSFENALQACIKTDSPNNSRCDNWTITGGNYNSFATTNGYIEFHHGVGNNSTIVGVELGYFYVPGYILLDSMTNVNCGQINYWPGTIPFATSNGLANSCLFMDGPQLTLATDAGTNAVNALSPIKIVSPATGQTLVYTNGVWTNLTAAGVAATLNLVNSTNLPAAGVSTNGAPAGVSVLTSSNNVSAWLGLPPGGGGGSAANYDATIVTNGGGQISASPVATNSTNFTLSIGANDTNFTVSISNALYSRLTGTGAIPPAAISTNGSQGGYVFTSKNNSASWQPAASSGYAPDNSTINLNGSSQLSAAPLGANDTNFTLATSNALQNAFNIGSYATLPTVAVAVQTGAPQQNTNGIFIGTALQNAGLEPTFFASVLSPNPAFQSLCITNVPPAGGQLYGYAFDTSNSTHLVSEGQAFLCFANDSQWTGKTYPLTLVWSNSPFGGTPLVPWSMTYYNGNIYSMQSAGANLTGPAAFTYAIPPMVMRSVSASTGLSNAPDITFTLPNGMTNGLEHLAFDGLGNIWTISQCMLWNNGLTPTNCIVEWSPSGTYIKTLGLNQMISNATTLVFGPGNALYVWGQDFSPNYWNVFMVNTNNGNVAEVLRNIGGRGSGANFPNGGSFIPPWTFCTAQVWAGSNCIENFSLNPIGAIAIDCLGNVSYFGAAKMNFSNGSGQYATLGENGVTGQQLDLAGGLEFDVTSAGLVGARIYPQPNFCYLLPTNGTVFDGYGTTLQHYSFLGNVRGYTNAGALGADMNLGEQDYTASANITLTDPINCLAGINNTAILNITNTSGSPITISGPAYWNGGHGLMSTTGAFNCTNFTQVLIEAAAGKWTNGIVRPMW